MTYRFLLLFLVLPLGSYGQSSDYLITNYTVNDGLPSNECHDVVQDSLGYIWIATDRGLVRWDGYEFKVYGIKEGLLDPACLSLDIDSNQNVWVNTMSGKLYIYRSATKNIIPYEYNQILVDSFNKTTLHDKISVSQTEDLIINTVRTSTWRITNSGRVDNLFKPVDNFCINILLFGEDLFLNHCNLAYLPYDTPADYKRRSESTYFDLLINGDTLEIDIPIQASGFSSELPSDGFVLHNDTIIFNIFGNNFIIAGNNILAQTPDQHSKRNIRQLLRLRLSRS